MCANKHCIYREKCYRATAPVSPMWQAWNVYDGPTLLDPDKICEMYWEDETIDIECGGRKYKVSKTTHDRVSDFRKKKKGA